MADQVAQGLLSPILQKARMNAAGKWLRGNVLDIGCGNGTLAASVRPESYTGFDHDIPTIEVAKQKFPDHRFVTSLPESGNYDTIAVLALIEHLPNPSNNVSEWARRLSPGGRMVLTTPHKTFRIVHDLGAKLGIFSADAAEEHEEMFNKQTLYELASSAGLSVVHYQRFLGGANQLLVLGASPK